MPYYHLMRISRLMQAMLFRNFFNFLFSKSYHPLPVLPPVFLSFSFVLSLSGASLLLTLPRLFFFSIIGTRTCVRKKDLRLLRLRLRFASPVVMPVFPWISLCSRRIPGIPVDLPASSGSPNASTISFTSRGRKVCDKLIVSGSPHRPHQSRRCGLSSASVLRRAAVSVVMMVLLYIYV